MRTQANLDALCSELETNCGDFYGACRALSLSPSFVRKWQSEDALVNETIENAAQCGALGLESEAIRRAKYGVDKAVYFKGQVVGHDKVYSDGLLQTLMKGRLSGTYGGDGTNINVNLGGIQIMPRANSYQEWMEMQKALPAPVEDAEFEPCLPDPYKDPAMADIL